MPGYSKAIVQLPYLFHTERMNRIPTRSTSNTDNVSLSNLLQNDIQIELDCMIDTHEYEKPNNFFQDTPIACKDNVCDPTHMFPLQSINSPRHNIPLVRQEFLSSLLSPNEDNANSTKCHFFSDASTSYQIKMIKQKRVTISGTDGGKYSLTGKRIGRPRIDRGSTRCHECATITTPQWRYLTTDDFISCPIKLRPYSLLQPYDDPHNEFVDTYDTEDKKKHHYSEFSSEHSEGWEPDTVLHSSFDYSNNKTKVSYSTTETDSNQLLFKTKNNYKVCLCNACWLRVHKAKQKLKKNGHLSYHQTTQLQNQSLSNTDHNLLNQEISELSQNTLKNDINLSKERNTMELSQYVETQLINPTEHPISDRSLVLEHPQIKNDTPPLIETLIPFKISSQQREAHLKECISSAEFSNSLCPNHTGLVHPQHVTTMLHPSLRPDSLNPLDSNDELLENQELRHSSTRLHKHPPHMEPLITTGYTRQSCAPDNPSCPPQKRFQLPDKVTQHNKAYKCHNDTEHYTNSTPRHSTTDPFKHNSDAPFTYDLSTKRHPMMLLRDHLHQDSSIPRRLWASTESPNSTCSTTASIRDHIVEQHERDHTTTLRPQDDSSSIQSNHGTFQFNPGSLNPCVIYHHQQTNTHKELMHPHHQHHHSIKDKHHVYHHKIELGNIQQPMSPPCTQQLDYQLSSPSHIQHDTDWSDSQGSSNVPNLDTRQCILVPISQNKVPTTVPTHMTNDMTDSNTVYQKYYKCGSPSSSSFSNDKTNQFIHNKQSNPIVVSSYLKAHSKQYQQQHQHSHFPSSTPYNDLTLSHLHMKDIKRMPPTMNMLNQILTKQSCDTNNSRYADKHHALNNMRHKWNVNSFGF